MGTSVDSPPVSFFFEPVNADDEDIAAAAAAGERDTRPVEAVDAADNAAMVGGLDGEMAG